MTQLGNEYPSMLWGVYHNTDLMVRGRGLSDSVRGLDIKTRCILHYITLMALGRHPYPELLSEMKG